MALIAERVLGRRTRHRWLGAALLLGLGACTASDQPDATGLTQVQKRALVERYYACARAGDSKCVGATLHPDFVTPSDCPQSCRRTDHAEALARSLASNRLEARILPREGTDVWVVEVWTTRHGGNFSLLRTFDFRDRQIVRKAALAG